MSLLRRECIPSQYPKQSHLCKKAGKRDYSVLLKEPKFAFQNSMAFESPLSLCIEGLLFSLERSLTLRNMNSGIRQVHSLRHVELDLW